MGQHADLSGVGEKALTLTALASTSHFFLFCDNLTALESTLKPQEKAQPLGLKSNLGKKPISKRSLSNGLKKGKLMCRPLFKVLQYLTNSNKLQQRNRLYGGLDQLNRQLAAGWRVYSTAESADETSP